MISPGDLVRIDPSLGLTWVHLYRGPDYMRSTEHFVTTGVLRLDGVALCVAVLAGRGQLRDDTVVLVAGPNGMGWQVTVALGRVTA